MFDLDAANINGVMPENIVDIYIAYTLCIKIMMPYLKFILKGTEFTKIRAIVLVDL